LKHSSFRAPPFATSLTGGTENSSRSIFDLNIRLAISQAITLYQIIAAKDAKTEAVSMIGLISDNADYERNGKARQRKIKIIALPIPETKSKEQTHYHACDQDEPR
jgi:hypothetical protein